MSTKSYYDILGVKETTKAGEISKIWRKLALKCKDDENKLKEINNAHTTLKDDDLRNEYDKKNGYGKYRNSALQTHDPEKADKKKPKPKDKVEVDLSDIKFLEDNNSKEDNAFKPTEYESNELKLNDNLPKLGSDGKPIYFSDLKGKHREELINDTRLLYGRTFNDNHTINEHLTYKIFKLKPKYNATDHFITSLKGNVETIAEYSETRTKAAEAGYTNIGASIGAAYSGPGISAEVKAGLKINNSNSSMADDKKESSSVIAQAFYPRGFISLDKRCVTLTNEFTKDFEVLYLNGNENDKKKFHNQYGHWANLEVQIGGKIHSTKTVEFSQSNTEDKAKNSYEASFSAKLSSCFGGASASAMFNTGSSNSDNAETISKISKMTLVSTGGESTYAANDDWTKWGNSVNSNYKTWAVIKVFSKGIANVLSLKDFMDSKYYDRIKDKYKKLQLDIEKNGDDITQQSKNQLIKSPTKFLVDIVADFDETSSNLPQFIQAIDGRSNDINCDFKGKWVYLCPKWGTSGDPSLDPVSDIEVVIGGDPVNGKDYTQDLAKGAGGKYRQLRLIRNKTDAITEITLWRSEKRKTFPSRQWYHHTEDINCDRRGDWLYICYKKEKIVRD